ncbi:MAG: tetraacyldisaccharide 4'-kinase [Candidatus Omnitrophica bacterium]|nr:tetraacyldisaccharide 4'-kinase [Candidatus Omnitrophota bacterium]
MVRLKKWYLAFLENDRKNFFELILYFLLYFLSLIYGVGVFFRNLFYEIKMASVFFSKAKVVSIGNLSWSGSGKTTLAIWLYQHLSSKYKAAILRRGYGQDEGKLLKEKTNDVFAAVKRVELAQRLENSFDLFILDDGFQHRRLARDVDIVMMSAKDFCNKLRLIPAYSFREPLNSLRRADILLLNYKNEMKDAEDIKSSILKVAPQLKIYFSHYKNKCFRDLKGNKFENDFLSGRRLAAFTAIGYPQGFLNKLAELNLDIVEKIVYPDHHELTINEFHRLEDDLISKGINDLVITHKDKYHFPCLESKLNIFVLEVELEIENQDEFVKSVEEGLAKAIKK